MTDDLAALCHAAEHDIATAPDLRALEAVRVALLGKTGRLTARLKELGALPPEARREQGARVNAVKEALTAALEARRAALEAAALEARLASERIDVSLPARPAESGLIHPISRAMDEIAAIFGAMGFTVAEGPDIETDWHNFGALNIPPHHPARADHDTFYLPPEADGDGPPRVLRTHTSPVQMRTMLAETPPIRIIAMGRTYRADHDATHSPMFHQCEGLVIDRDITLGHLKGCLTDFLRAFSASPISRCAFAPAISRSPNPRWRSISAGTAGAANSAVAATGWRFWGAAWSTPKSSPMAASIRANGRASPSAWESSASPC